MKKLAFFIALSALLACKNGDDVSVAESKEESTVAGAEPATDAITLAANASPQVVSEQKIIREANLRFESPDLQETYARIQRATKKHNGLIQNDSEGKDFDSQFRNITVRVPADKFDVFLEDISHGVAYFDRKEISAHDVTEEFVDVQARLKTKKAVEARYVSLLSKATKISEIVEIEKELAAIREEIESKEGRLKYLQDRVAMSTFTIEIYKSAPAESGATVSYGSKMWNAIKSGFNGVSMFFLGLLHIWPFILILVLVFFGVRRRFRKKTI